MNQKLEPYFWINNKLNSEIKAKLSEIAESFYTESEIDFDIQDILISGFIAGYNYNDTSTVDVNLIFDLEGLNISTINNALLAKAEKWNLNHDIFIDKYQVQIYIGDVLDKSNSNGIYSILENNWIKLPESNEIEEIDVSKVDSIVLELSNFIDNLQHDFESDNSTENSKIINDKIKEFKQDFKAMVQVSIDLYGKEGTGMKVYRKLKDNGYFEKIKLLQNKSFDNIFTENKLKENKTNWINYTDDDLIKKYKDYNNRKYELGLIAAKDFLDLEKEIKKRNIKNLNESALKKDLAKQMLDKTLNFPEVNATIYYKIKDNDEYSAAGFSGKKDKADFYYKFQNKERFDQYVEKYINNLKSNIESKLKYKEGKKINAKAIYDKINVGDIIYTSWGYDQTNIDFYQITGKFGSNSLKVRELDDKDVTKSNSGISSMAGFKIPIKDKFTGTEKTIRVMGYLKVDNHIAYIWDGKPIYYSWYA